MKKKALYPLLTLAVALVIAALVIANKPQPAADDYVALPPTVRTVIAHVASETLVVRSQGTVQPRTESQLIPEVAGRVVWMSPALVSGGSFQAQEPLLRIDAADYDNAVAKAKASLSRAQVEEEHTSDSSHITISYAVFCLKKKKKKPTKKETKNKNSTQNKH